VPPELQNPRRKVFFGKSLFHDQRQAIRKVSGVVVDDRGKAGCPISPASSYMTPPNEDLNLLTGGTTEGLRPEAPKMCQAEGRGDNDAGAVWIEVTEGGGVLICAGI
jgi:hypothetical protein